MLSPGHLQKGQAILQQLKSSDLEEVAKTTTLALSELIPFIAYSFFTKPLVVREKLISFKIFFKNPT